MVQSKLVIRTKYLALSWIPMLGLYILARTSAWGEAYHSIAVSAPYLVALCVAAWLPQGIPPSMAPVATTVMVIFGAVDGNFAMQQWQTDCTPHIRLLRTLVPGSFSLGNMLLGVDLLLHRARRWWYGLRLDLTVCCAIRLGAVVMLKQLGAASNSFPPGNMTFTTSVCYNLACIALATVGFSPPCRQYLSELTGGSCVVLRLADVSELPADERNTWDLHEATRVRAPREPSHASGNAHRGDGSSVRSAARSRNSNRSGRSGHRDREGRVLLFLGQRERQPNDLTGLSIPGAQHRPYIRKRRWHQVRRDTMYPEDFATAADLFLYSGAAGRGFSATAGTARSAADH